MKKKYLFMYHLNLKLQGEDVGFHRFLKFYCQRRWLAVGMASKKTLCDICLCIFSTIAVKHVTKMNSILS